MRLMYSIYFMWLKLMFLSFPVDNSFWWYSHYHLQLKQKPPIPNGVGHGPWLCNMWCHSNVIWLCVTQSSVSIACQLDPCLGTRLEDILWAKISPTYPVLGRVMNDRCINVRLNMNADQLCSSYQQGGGRTGPRALRSAKRKANKNILI